MKLLFIYLICLIWQPIFAAPIKLNDIALEWEVTNWGNSKPLTLNSLSGQVILVRWMMPGCPFCTASSKILNQWEKEFENQDLVIVGFWFRSNRVLSDKEIDQNTKKLDIKFPVAYDRENKTAIKWFGKTTSPSVLIDRKGMVRHIHHGGRYEVDDEAELKELIKNLLNEKGQPN